MENIVNKDSHDQAKKYIDCLKKQIYNKVIFTEDFEFCKHGEQISSITYKPKLINTMKSRENGEEIAVKSAMVRSAEKEPRQVEDMKKTQINSDTGKITSGERENKALNVVEHVAATGSATKRRGSEINTVETKARKLNLDNNYANNRTVTKFHGGEYEDEIAQCKGRPWSYNPFKYVDDVNLPINYKLDPPVLMVHSKINDPIIPCFDLKDISFNSHIQTTLNKLGLQNPKKVQTISWPTILCGFSFIMISPPGSGKTMGYIPAVCRLVADGASRRSSISPIFIILCATSKLVATVERICKYFLGSGEKVFACYPNIPEFEIAYLQPKRYDLFICTPPCLIRLVSSADYGIDLLRLSTLVFDDYEKLTEVFEEELKVINFKINEILKRRGCKERKLQYILTSRVWCESMGWITNEVDPVICIGAFQECVVYSKAKTQVSFVKNCNKIDVVFDFLGSVDSSKRTVIVCNNCNEVEILKAALSNKYNVFACHSTMNSDDGYEINILSKYYGNKRRNPKASVIVCCDSDLSKINVIDAYNLLIYSLPDLFSLFYKRFSVLTDNYASIFQTNNESIKIKILIEECNKIQLPQLLHFLNRCNSDVPRVLDDISDKALLDEDVAKAKSLVPLCEEFLSFGECPDFWHCRQRHTIFKEYDEPKVNIPKEGVITFKILHYHSPVHYTALLLTRTVNGVKTIYSEEESKYRGILASKMQTYYTKVENIKMHRIPRVGDICAVFDDQNCYRCEIVKIIDPNKILIRLLDGEQFLVVKNFHLYYLPKEFSKKDTHIIQVRLANLHPKDQNIRNCKLAQRIINEITDPDFKGYISGKIVLAIGNCIFVDNPVVWEYEKTFDENVAKYSLNKKLSPHVVRDTEHLEKLMKMCTILDICKKQEN